MKKVVFVFGGVGPESPIDNPTIMNMDRALRFLEDGVVSIVYVSLNTVGREKADSASEYIQRNILGSHGDNIISRVFISESQGPCGEKFVEYMGVFPDEEVKMFVYAPAAYLKEAIQAEIEEAADIAQSKNLRVPRFFFM